MADIPEEVRARMVPISNPLRLVRRYSGEERQWPRNMAHPSGKRPIYADLVLQEQWIDPQGGISGMATAAREWRDVFIVPGVEGLPEDHEFTREDFAAQLRASSLTTDFKGR